MYAQGAERGHKPFLPPWLESTQDLHALPDGSLFP